ncbi:hypothetical protein ACFYRC_34255 [Streptomyces sp. NPDC005279]|uniref:hypothetical protein n=1 Tax=Streptomyces sp. NPDC005279 TaxID=3364712 RepID=UPI00367C3AE0
MIGAHEGEDEGALGLAGGAFAGDAVFLGFSASGFIGGGCLQLVLDLVVKRRQVVAYGVDPGQAVHLVLGTLLGELRLEL